MTPITVLIPVGPQAEYLLFLEEAINSVMEQDLLPDEVLLIADGFPLSLDLIKGMVLKYSHAVEMFSERNMFTLCPIDGHKVIQFRIWKTPWNIGFAPAFNCGVGLADNECILYLASDDKLMPGCIADCLKAYEDNNHKDAWYALSYVTQNGIEGNIPNNAAMITKNLWSWMGGYPPAAFAGPDALLLSCLMRHAPDKIVKVAEGKPNYWVREHPDQDTKRQFSFYAASGIMEVIRNKETERFKPHAEVVLK